jgi:cellulose synthase/poly-beta-1,6-N-acetylglucosamine synthase-like glycosyltransferase
MSVQLRITKRSSQQFKLMRHFSTLAGSFQKLPKNSDYHVGFTGVADEDSRFYRYWSRTIAYGALLLAVIFGLTLFQPAHWIVLQQPHSPTHIENWIMLICLILLQLFVIVSTLSATRSTIVSKDPVPVRPPKHLRVAFATTRAPGEPISMVQATLQAAKQVIYMDGTVDVWLLDETNDPELHELCQLLGVKYFSRAGKPAWNTAKPKRMWLKRAIFLIRCKITGVKAVKKRQVKPNPYFAAKSKHGNYNAWRKYLARNYISYDILAGVDTDQVPEPNYLQRLLGYFHDPDVAYVVGPQVYSNYRPGLAGLVARWAESQASFFQSTIQRAGNASQSAMFVGTNYALRMSALDQIGGFQPCITEDMATGLAIHATRNPITGQHWKSVYTPDVLALGSGPDFWGPYFTQQWRWAAGTFDTWRRMVWRIFFKLPARARLHYFLILTYYPIVASTWLLAIISSMVYLITGATAILASWGQFVSLYLMTVVLQLSLYFWNRRANVSPHEPGGSYGIAGMAISSLTAPIYLSAMIGIALGKRPQFVVTKKDSSENPDWFATFRTHLQWAGLLLIGFIYGILHGRDHPAMLIWAGVLMVICLTPFVLGMALAGPARLNAKRLDLKEQLVASDVEVRHA